MQYFCRFTAWDTALSIERTPGELDVIWKVADDHGVNCYRTWIKFNVGDFMLGVYPDETAKREANRKAFRRAFSQWREQYPKL